MIEVATDADCLLVPELSSDALRRCAAGEIIPEVAVIELLSQVRPDNETEAELGTAIWNAPGLSTGG